jgi:2-dehydropantoate 2-reductase
MLARAGNAVTLIGRSPHVEAIRRDGLLLDTVHFTERVAVEASTEARAAEGCELVLFCVKTLDTAAAARQLRPYVGPQTVVISLQNGVDNVENMRTAAGIAAIPSVVYLAADMSGSGHVKHRGRGELTIGYPGGAVGPSLEPLAQFFRDAEIPCRISEDITADLWTKLVVNCGFNAISALGKANYGRMVGSSPTMEVMRRTIEEVIAVGKAAGVRFPDTNLPEAVFRLKDSMGEAISSTAQDITRGKKTEIDALNGYVARRGRDLGIPTPVNQSLYALVKLLEEAP